MNTGTVGNLHALLIGVDHYLGTLFPDRSYYPRLGGCVRDIEHVEAFLTSRLGLQPDHILKLLASLSKEEQPLEPEQQRPTYANMVRMLKELSARAKPGDRVIVYYSGHGGRARTAFTEIKGEDGLDEALVPYDIGNPGSRYLRDIELAYLLKDMVANGLVVTIVFDSCHSGGATRGVGTATPRTMVPGPSSPGFDTSEPPKDSLVAPLSELESVWSGLTRGVARAAKPASGWLAEPEGYTLLAACRANESAYEDCFNGREKNGALTYWLLDSLRTMGPNTSYKELHTRILAKIRSWMEAQTPQLQGQGDLTVFGAERIQSHYAILVLEVDAAGKRVRLNAGEVHGLQPGSLLAVYPANVRDLSLRDARQALVEVTELFGDTDSWATVIEEFGRGTIEQAGQALVVGSKDPQLQRSVGLALKTKETVEELGESCVDARAQSLADAIERHGGGFIRLAQEADSVDLQVALNQTDPGDYEIWDGCGVVIPNLRPPIKCTDPDAAERIAKRLVHLAKYQRIRALDNPDPILAQKVKAELVRQSSETAQGHVAELTPGEKFALKITNLLPANPAHRDDSSRILNVTVLDLAPDWSIVRIVPHPDNASAFEIIQPDASLLREFEVFLPPGYIEATDIFKIFATQRTTDFRWLELPPLDQPPSRKDVQRRNISDTLERLLETFTADNAPPKAEMSLRQIKEVSYAAKDKPWAVVQLEVFAKRRGGD